MENEQNVQPPEQENGITIQDLYSAAQIIDAATRRGAFGAAEAGSVGAVYGRLIRFLESTAPHLFQDEQVAEGAQTEQGDTNE